jgi:hypothetical protein
MKNLTSRILQNALDAVRENKNEPTKVAFLGAELIASLTSVTVQVSASDAVIVEYARFDALPSSGPALKKTAMMLNEASLKSAILEDPSVEPAVIEACKEHVLKLVPSSFDLTGILGAVSGLSRTSKVLGIISLTGNEMFKIVLSKDSLFLTSLPGVAGLISKLGPMTGFNAASPQDKSNHVRAI